ncbi:MAG: hypothetical protein M0Q15_03665 [Nevskia sp.]|jgi:hypothetical protein|nr:hypothetical protein [Nevskia sp.]
MSYNVKTAATFHDAELRRRIRAGQRWAPVMITLTYRPGVDPEPRHISEFLQRVRKWMKRRDEVFRFVWVGELTQRGVLHYHVVTWLPAWLRLPKPDQQRSRAIPGTSRMVTDPAFWPHGHTRIEWARAPIGYVAKYASKLQSKGLTQATFPRGFRIFGVGGLDTEDKERRAWANLPGWLRDHVTPAYRMLRISGGWVSRETWDFWPSIWRLGRVVMAGTSALISLIPAFPDSEIPCPFSFASPK